MIEIILWLYCPSQRPPAFHSIPRSRGYGLVEQIIEPFFRILFQSYKPLFTQEPYITVFRIAIILDIAVLDHSDHLLYPIFNRPLWNEPENILDLINQLDGVALSLFGTGIAVAWRPDGNFLVS